MTYFARAQDWVALPVCHDERVLHRAFYHFFFAVLLPLCELSRRKIFGNQRIYIKSCGTFDPILREISPLLTLKIIPSLDVIPLISKTGSNLDFFILDSLEGHFYRNGRFCIRPSSYDGERLRAIAAHVKDRLRPETTSPACQCYGNQSEVTFILRGGKTAGLGNSSRSLAARNAGLICSALWSAGISVSTIRLEGKSLAEQIAIFDNSRVILAQHGAALSNLVWTRPARTRVVEIVPPKFAQPGWHYFDALCSALEIPRTEIRQTGNFSAVDPDDVVKEVQSAMSCV